VIVSKGNFKPMTVSAVRFKFRTFSPDGLMFLMGHSKDYFSIEIKEGKVISRYDLGSGSAVLSSAQNSQQNYNDGKWHALYMNRRQNDGILKIDDITGKLHMNFASVHNYISFVCLDKCLKLYVLVGEAVAS
jgi:Laminin G domain